MKKPVLLIGLGVGVIFILWRMNNKRKPPARRQRTITPTITNPDFLYSVVDGGMLTSGYLAERHRHDGVHIHKGIDIAAIEGTPIRAVSDGTVFLLWPDGEIDRYGNTVVIKNNDGRASLYAHMQHWEPSLQINMPVLQGQIIGFVGKTEKRSKRGLRTGGTSSKTPIKPHLHLEVHANAQRLINKDTPPRLDPEVYLESMGMNIG